jgi:hypothetical protein
VSVEDLVQAAQVALLENDSPNLYSERGLSEKGLQLVDSTMQREWRFGSWHRGQNNQYRAEGIVGHQQIVLPEEPSGRSPLMELLPEEKDVVAAIVGHKRRTVEGITRQVGRNAPKLLENIVQRGLAGEVAKAARSVTERIEVAKPIQGAQRRYYWRRRLMGLCCCGAIAQKGLSMCSRCAEDNRVQCAEYRQRNLSEIRAKECIERASFKAAGLCAVCGNDPPEAGRTSCKSCLERHREWSRHYRERHWERVNRMARERRAAKKQK